MTTTPDLRILSIKGHEWYRAPYGVDRMYRRDDKTEVYIVAQADSVLCMFFSLEAAVSFVRVETARTTNPSRRKQRIKTAEEYTTFSESESAADEGLHPCDGHFDCFCKLACGCHWVIEGEGVSE